MNDSVTYTNVLLLARKIVGEIVPLRFELDPGGNDLVLVAGPSGLERDFDYVDPNQIRPFLTLARGDSPAAIAAVLGRDPCIVRAKALIASELERSRRCR